MKVVVLLVFNALLLSLASAQVCVMCHNPVVLGLASRLAGQRTVPFC